LSSVALEKSKVRASRLPLEHGKFASHVMVSEVYFDGKAQRPTPTVTLIICCQIWWNIVVICWKICLAKDGMQAHVAKVMTDCAVTRKFI